MRAAFVPHASALPQARRGASFALSVLSPLGPHPASPSISAAAAPAVSRLPSSACLRPASSECRSSTPTAVLWLRVGELRARDNGAVLSAAAHRGCIVPVLTLPRGFGSAVAEAARDLRRAFVAAGSGLHVVVGEGGDQGHARMVEEVVRVVGARVVFVNGSAGPALLRGVLSKGVRVVGVEGGERVLCRAPIRMPDVGEKGMRLGEGGIRGVGCSGESAATARLRRLCDAFGGGGPVVEGLMWREVRLGCISKERIRTEVRLALERRGVFVPSGQQGADGRLALLSLSAVAYDVNGGDRRGIEWDEAKGKFQLKEWEHAETERRMNAKQRGSEFVRRRKMFFYRAFFPEDVTPDYYSFTAWRFAQRCVSATVGVFGTQALLLALGVKAGRIGQAAAISWVLKDGLGRVGKMLWAGSMGKDFDVDPKRWRFRSALLYACGNGMEIVTQIFPASFLVFATIANSMKQVSMLTSSATRNAMYRSFGGRAQNIANITAKGEAQIVVADLIGMACGIQLSKAIGTSKGNVLAAYTCLTALDTIGIYMELRQVVFRTLNAERSSLVIEEFVKSGRVLKPSDVSRKESIFLKPRYRAQSRFSSVVKAAQSPDELDMLLHVFRNERFLVSLPKPRKRTGKRSGPCRVVLRNDARHEDVFRALLTVGYLRDRCRNGKRLGWLNGNSTPESDLRAARRAARKATPGLTKELRNAGWNVDNLLFGTVKRGASWGTAKGGPSGAST